MDRHDALKLFTEHRHFKARVGGEVHEDVFITALNDGSASAATLTVLLPTPLGEPDRFRRWRVDQVEVVT